jgi:hypothetical protein
MFIDVVVRRSLVASLIAVLAACVALAQTDPAGPQSRTRPTPAVVPSQFEFVGSWAPLGTEDVQNDSVPVDYLGLALTDEGRTRALSYDESQKSMIERQCQGWGALTWSSVRSAYGSRVSRTNRSASCPTRLTRGKTGWR